MVRLDAGIPDPRPRQLRDAQQSCRYPTREYQLDRPSLKMAPPRSLSGSSTAIRSPRRGQNQLVSFDKESHINVRSHRRATAKVKGKRMLHARDLHPIWWTLCWVRAKHSNSTGE